MSQAPSIPTGAKKTVPLWSLFLVSLLVLGSVVGVFMADPQLANALSPRPTAPAQDFTLSSSQTSIHVKQGDTGSTILTVASLNGFSNTTGLSISLPVNGTGVLTSTLNPAIVTPSSGGKANATLYITASSSAGIGNYPFSVTATTGSRTHTVQLTLVVSPVPDFAISTMPSPMIVARGGSSSATITVTSRYGFSGNVSLTMTAPFAVIGIVGGLSPLWLTNGGTNSTIFAVSTSNQTAIGTYLVTVTGTSGSVTRTLQISVGVISVSSGRESLGLDSVSFTGNTNVTLYIRNTGNVPVTLAAYYVKDPSSDQYANTAWSGPTINPNTAVPVNVLIGASCSSCSLSGTAFTFVSGYSYTILFVTSRNNQFIFTVVR